MRLTGSLGLDTARFGADVKSPWIVEEVDSELKQGLALEITGTPESLAGRTPIMGAQPDVVFTKATDDALRKAG